MNKTQLEKDRELMENWPLELVTRCVAQESTTGFLDGFKVNDYVHGLLAAQRRVVGSEILDMVKEIQFSMLDTENDWHDLRYKKVYKETMDEFIRHLISRIDKFIS